jgi:hypothetical protein
VLPLAQLLPFALFLFNQLHLNCTMCCKRVFTLPAGQTPPPAAADLLLQEQEAARNTRETSAGFDTATKIHNDATATRCLLNAPCSVRHAPPPPRYAASLTMLLQ